jgi:DinB superfamily
MSADPLFQPPSPLPDDKDWTWVLREVCPECGFDATALDRGEIPARTRTAMASFSAALRRPDAATRPASETWSALEYACHVRDVCRIFGERVRLMLTEDDPVFPNWNQDETALADHYWAQDPEVVAIECTSAGDSAAARFEDLPDDAWTRPGRRSNGSVFTVDSIGRYFLHDLTHHLHDISG